MAASRPAVAAAVLLLLALLSVGVNATTATATAKARAGEGVTPLNKVLQLLEDMVKKAEKAMQEEKVELAKLMTWCKETEDATSDSIDDETAEIEQSDAEITDDEADAEEAEEDAEELEDSSEEAQKQLDNATRIREKEREDYLATHKDLTESIDAIERAIAVLKSREADTPQSLIQVREAKGMPQEAKAVIESFLAQAAEDNSEAAPEANAYEFQSGGVVKMLEELRHKFQDERLALEKEEMNAKAEYEILKQRLSDNIKEDTKRKNDKTERKAAKLEDAAGEKGDKGKMEDLKVMDEKKLSDTQTSCQAKKEEYQKNQVTRAEEIEAIKKALEILQSDDVSGNADKHLPALIQLRRNSVMRALVQLRGGESPEESMRREQLTTFLQSRARDIGSRYLSLVATHAGSDPFAKVKKMIKDMILKLMEQASSEADHKAYCDTELATNKQTRTNKQSEVEELTAGIEKRETETAQLAEQLAALGDSVAELRKEQEKATELRQEEKATNNQTIVEAKAAQMAVERAMKVLKDFYGQAAEASLLQSDSGLEEEMREDSQAPYKGMQGESGGVVGFLEVILSDFTRLETETQSAEDDAQSSYEKFMDESNEDVAVKETEMGHKEHKKQDTEAETSNMKKELELTQKELSAAMDYYEKLKPDCVDKGLSFEDRVRMREEEIQSLKEALQILDQQDLA